MQRFGGQVQCTLNETSPAASDPEVAGETPKPGMFRQLVSRAIPIKGFQPLQRAPLMQAACRYD